jgi:16S rRNA (adenine1518-N6/adenine1519-N6)-dimethyltransferase
MNTPPKAKKSLGQHWLSDEESLRAICAAADITKDDTVLEIGPGTGTLTKRLTARAGRVVGVELDELLAIELPYRVPDENLTVINQDILRFDFSGLPPDYKIVANIPYYLTSNLVRVISETANPPRLTVLLVQKELAERAAAGPGAMSLLSVSAQFYWQVSLGSVVAANKFTPPPKVDSRVLILKRRDSPLFGDVETKLYFRLVKSGFASRRKTLLNSLSGGLRLGKPETAEVLKAAWVKPTARPQELSLDDWYKLCRAAWRFMA